jgi:ElaB/YqjD/DUF883 family membrane-anchored ribosome-binding protein
MSTIEPGKGPGGNSFAKTATRAASLIDENVHWGADAVSNIARQTAGQVERATDYVQQQGQKIKQQATQLGEKASEHPVYALLAVGALGFTLGFLLRGSRTKA